MLSSCKIERKLQLFQLEKFIMISKISMIPAILTIGSFGLPTISFFLFFGFLLFLFLFWRAAKHEFVDEEIVFDTLVICLVSSLFFARIFEFTTNSVIYKWSFSNFFFLNPIRSEE